MSKENHSTVDYYFRTHQILKMPKLFSGAAKKKKKSYFEANMLENKNSSHKSLYKIKHCAK